jgi:hypothetical protein
MLLRALARPQLDERLDAGRDAGEDGVRRRRRLRVEDLPADAAAARVIALELELDPALELDALLELRGQARRDDRVRGLVCATRALEAEVERREAAALGRRAQRQERLDERVPAPGDVDRHRVAPDVLAPARVLSQLRRLPERLAQRVEGRAAEADGALRGEVRVARARERAGALGAGRRAPRHEAPMALLRVEEHRPKRRVDGRRGLGSRPRARRVAGGDARGCEDRERRRCAGEHACYEPGGVPSGPLVLPHLPPSPSAPRSASHGPNLGWGARARQGKSGRVG